METNADGRDVGSTSLLDRIFQLRLVVDERERGEEDDDDGRLLLLDVCCCAGGAARGYQRAGFYVIGVDIENQPRYAGDAFVRADAIEFLDALVLAVSTSGHRLRVSAVHASPPCQAHSDLQKQNKRHYTDLIGPVRDRLSCLGIPYVIENVEGAPLCNPAMLCGANKDAFPHLRVIRHRLFETNWPLRGVPCPPKHPLVFTHDKRKAHYGKLDQSMSYIQVTGGGNATKANKLDAMDIDWNMNSHEVNEALPPAYTEYVGRQLVDFIRQTRYVGEPEHRLALACLLRVQPPPLRLLLGDNRRVQSNPTYGSGARLPDEKTCTLPKKRKK